MNLPNKLTILRVCMIPFFVFFFLYDKIPGNNYIALVLFIVAALTDALDGHIARKYNLITNFGKFMDPLADKLLVCSALICFVEKHMIPVWIVIIIIAREFIISGFRLVAAEQQIVIAAGFWGKLKTIVQMIMVPLMIANIDHSVVRIVETVFIYASLVLTIVSLVDYLVKNKAVLSSENKK